MLKAFVPRMLTVKAQSSSSDSARLSAIKSGQTGSKWYIYYLTTYRSMALSIKNQETDRLAHDLAEATGETVTVAVTRAIQNRLDSLRPRARRARLLSDIREIQDLMKSLPDKDMRSADDLLGYGDFGLPR